MSVTWFQRIVFLLGGGYIEAYRLEVKYTTPGLIARMRSDINWAKHDLESKLARVREADSILNEIETYEAQDSGV